MKRQIIASFAVLLVSAGCSTLRYAPVERTEVRDSVRVEVRERLVTDTVRVEIPHMVDRIVTADTVSVLENPYARSEASVKSGLLHHTLETVPHTEFVEVTVPVHDTVYVSRLSEVAEKTVTVERSKPIPLAVRLMAAGFWLLITALLFCIFLSRCRVR